MTILIPVVGFLFTTLVLLLWYPKQIKTGRLSAFYTVDSARTLSSLDQKSLEYKLIASGLNIKPVTFRLLRIAAGVCGMVIAWLFLPSLPAIVIGGILIYIPGAWLDGRMKSRGWNIDQLLPIAIGRTAAGLLAGISVPDVLAQVGESLEMEKTNPLTPEFILTASEMRIKDRVEALRSLAFRSPSVSLANLAQLLEGYTEAGGRACTAILMDISSRVQQILLARNRAQAKAGDSLVSAKVLPAVLILILIYLSQDPMVRSSLTALPVQIVIGSTMAAMVVFRFENVQIVSHLIDGKFPDYQANLPKGHKTRAVLDAGVLLKACKQASIIAGEGNNVVRFHFQPGADQTGRVRLLAESDETGASEIELDATVEGQELEIAFNVKFLQDGLEAITTKKVTIEANAHNTPAVLHSTGDEENLYVLMPMHIDGK